MEHTCPMSLISMLVFDIIHISVTEHFDKVKCTVLNRVVVAQAKMKEDDNSAFHGIFIPSKLHTLTPTL